MSLSAKGNDEATLEGRLARCEAALASIACRFPTPGAARRTAWRVPKVAHGWTVGTALRRDSTGWVGSQADTDAHALVDAIVVKVVNPDVVRVSSSGSFKYPGAVDGTQYYLSETVAGEVVTTAPAKPIRLFKGGANDTAIVNLGSPTADIAPSLVVEAIQAAHGFSVGNVVKNIGTGWALASQGDDKIGVVCKVVDTDTVWICEWGLVCITGATFTANAVYYLGSTPGTLSTTAGTPKRSVLFAVSSSLVLVTGPSKDAAGGGLDAITGPALLGKYDAGFGVPAAIPASTDDSLFGRRGGVLTFAKVATAEIADAAVTTVKIADANVTTAKIADANVAAAKLANTTVVPAAYGSATMVATFTVDAQGRLSAAAQVTVTPAWSSITGKPTYFDTQISGANDSSDVTNSGALVVSGVPNNNLITLYEKRPRFNAKWLLGAQLAASAGTMSGSSNAYSFMWWDKTNLAWSPFTFWNPTGLTIGDINCYDSGASDGNAKMTTVRGGTAYSVFGNFTNAAALPLANAVSDGQVLARVGSTMGGTKDPVLGTSGSGGSFKIWFTSTSYVEFNVSSSGTVKVTFPNGSVTLSNSDFGSDTGQVIKLTKIAECDSAGAAKSRYYLCGAQF